MIDRRWIRGPWWDGVWILSGLPVGLLLLGASLWIAPPRLSLFGTAVVGFAHVLSPIALAWAHPEMRRIALSRRAKLIGLPALVLAASAGVGLVAYVLPPLAADLTFPSVAVQPEDYRNPLVVLMAIYIVWNAYHFGVLTIYRMRAGGGVAGQREWDLVFCLLTITVATAIPMVPHLSFRSHLFKPVEWGVVGLAVGSVAVMLSREASSGIHAPRALFIVSTALGPLMMLWWGFWASTAVRHWPWLARLPLWPALWGFALLSMNHWLVSIGLAGHVFSRRQLGSLGAFVAAVTLAGAAVFAVLFVDFRTLAIHVTAVAVALRLGLGFVHFLYDRWLYRFSDPAVRATLGRDVFGPPVAQPGFAGRS